MKNCDPAHLGIPALYDGANSELNLKIDSNSNTVMQHERVEHPAEIPDNTVRCQTFGEESRVSDQE